MLPVWEKCMMISNISNGFRATGICPFNKNAIPEHAFAPSLPTHQDENEEVDDTETAAENGKGNEHKTPEQQQEETEY